MDLIKLSGKDCKGIVLGFDEENGKLEWKSFFGNAGAVASIPECNGAFFLDTDSGRFDGDKFKAEKTGDSQFLLHVGTFEVRLSFKADEETGVISIKPYVKNTDSKDHVIYSCFPRIPVYGNDYEVYGQYTAWCAENQGDWMTLAAGNIELTNSAGSSSVSCTPFACLRNRNTGNTVAFHVLPIGDWFIRFRRIAGHRTGYTVIEAGLSDAGLRLDIAAGAELEMPEILMYSFSGDLKTCGEPIQRYILPRFPKRHIPDPIFNTWFYNYDVLDAEVLKKQVPVAKKLGIKTFVIDAGWFGTGIDWENQVGCWQENTTRAFHGKMREFSDFVRENGMDFGLWMEPQRAGRETEIYRNHPDWFMDEDAVIYDLTKPEVRAFIVDELSHLVKTYDLKWMKLDYNTDMFRDLTGTNYYYYYIAERELYREFQERNPQVTFEGCAGGGARTDIPNVFNLYHGHFVSDTVHPLEVLRSRQNVAMRMTPAYMGSWIVAQEVKFPVNTYTDHDIDKRTKVITCGDAWWEQTVDYSLDFVMACNLIGEYGFSADLAAFSEKNQEIIRKANLYGIKHKELLETSIAHLLTEPKKMNDISGWELIQLESEKLEESLVFAFRLTDDAESYYVFPKGIDTSRRYAVEFYDGTCFETDGADIVNYGIRIDCPTRYSAMIVDLKAI